MHGAEVVIFEIVFGDGGEVVEKELVRIVGIKKLVDGFKLLLLLV